MKTDSIVIRMKQKQKSLVAGSLFSGGGLGDIGIEWGCGIPVIGACEIIHSRSSLLRKNFPNTQVFEGDIWKIKEEYIAFFKKRLRGEYLLRLGMGKDQWKMSVTALFFQELKY